MAAGLLSRARAPYYYGSYIDQPLRMFFCFSSFIIYISTPDDAETDENSAAQNPMIVPRPTEAGYYS